MCVCACVYVCMCEPQGVSVGERENQRMVHKKASGPRTCSGGAMSTSSSINENQMLDERAGPTANWPADSVGPEPDGVSAPPTTSLSGRMMQR
jgi:hypothetical protein